MVSSSDVGSSRRSPTWSDAMIALIVLLVDVGGVLITSRQDGQPKLSELGAAYLVAAAVPLVWRRRSPVVVCLLVGVATASFGIAELPDPPVQVALLVALFTVAAHEPRHVTVEVAVIATLGAAAGIVLAGDSGPDDYYAFFLPGVLALVLGDRQRTRVAYLAEVQAHVAALEIDQRRVAERAIEAERARIARELHDVVAHHVSMIVVQAEAGAVSLAGVDRGASSSSARGSERFDAIARTGRAAMTELRRLLGVLRDCDQRPTTEPQPGLDQVGALVDQVHEAGLEVTLTVEGQPRSLSDGVDVSAYRIVQEALTNVVRHAGSAPARVLVRYGVRAIDICVENDGRPPDERTGGRRPTADLAPAGHGLVGIRERVALLDGDLRVGQRPDGGFEVAVRLPIDGSGPGG